MEASMGITSDSRTTFGMVLCAVLLTAYGVTGCDDPPLDDAAKEAGAGDTTGADGNGRTGDGEAVDGAASDVQPDINETVDATTVDSGPEDTLAPDSEPTDAGAADVGSADAGGEDASDQADSGSSNGDAGAADAGAQDPCGDCVWDQQPTGDHPSAKSKASLLEPKKVEFGSGLFEGYKEMLVIRPLKPGIHPVLFFVPGKQLHTTGGIISAKLGHAYMALLEHIARRGYIVAFVRVENGLTDCDHGKMANNLLEATQKLFEVVSLADKDRVAFAGHSMGAKIAILAAAKTLNDDKKGKWVDPEAVFAFNVSNEKPTICLAPWQDASAAVKYIDAASKVRFTFVQTEDDKVAPYKDKTKPNALAIYNNLKVKWRQLIILHGTGKDDPNPATDPELHDDHAAPLTVKGNVGGVADLGMPPSYLDGLDWYGYWKILVGGLDFHFLKGDAKWAYGDLRTHGGNLPGGKMVTHQVLKQGW